MVNPQTVFSAVARETAAATPLTTVLTREADLDGVDGDVRSPFGELQLVNSQRLTAFNTDRVGFVLDESGNRVGELFAATFDADLQLDVFVAAGDDRHDATDLGYQTQRALRRFDSREQAVPLTDGDGAEITDVTQVEVGDASRADDLAGGPGIRRWRQDLRVEFEDLIDTTEQDGDAAFVASVDTPAAGDFTDGDSAKIEYVPSGFDG